MISKYAMLALIIGQLLVRLHILGVCRVSVWVWDFDFQLSEQFKKLYIWGVLECTQAHPCILMLTTRVLNTSKNKVRKAHVFPEMLCGLKCNMCNIIYVIICLDSIIRTNMCKHIHAIYRVCGSRPNSVYLPYFRALEEKEENVKESMVTTEYANE